MKLKIAVLLLAILSASPFCLAMETLPYLNQEFRRSLFTFSISASSFLASNIGIPKPTQCGWCSASQFEVDFSAGLIWTNDKSGADTYSDVIVYTVLPALSGLVTFYEPKERLETLLSILTIVNTAILTYSLTEALKRGTARARPNISMDGSNEGDQEFLSFPSGHTSLAFALATSSSFIAFKRNYSFAPFILFFGSVSALATGYLRIAAEKHWLTDVVGGAALGMFVGAFVPLFTYATVTPMPNAHGISISAAW